MVSRRRLLVNHAAAEKLRFIRRFRQPAAVLGALLMLLGFGGRRAGAAVAEVDVLRRVGIAELGRRFSRMTQHYMYTMGRSTDPPVARPPYEMALMGGWAIPSMRLVLPLGPPSQVPTRAEPQGIARVVHAHHLGLRKMLNRVEAVGDFPPRGVTDLLASEAVQVLLRADQQARSKGLRGEADPANEPLQAALGVVAHAVVELFSRKRTLELSLVDAEGSAHTVILPNERVSIDVEHAPAGLGAGPLAGIFWGLKSASRGLLAAPEAAILGRLVGAQDSLTQYAGVLLDRIQPQLPTGRDIYDYLAIDGTALGRVIAEQAHALKMATIMNALSGHKSDGYQAMLALVDQSLAGFSLAEASIQRDVPILLHNTGRLLGAVGKAVPNQDPAKAHAVNSLSVAAIGLAGQVAGAGGRADLKKLLYAERRLLRQLLHTTEGTARLMDSRGNADSVVRQSLTLAVRSIFDWMPNLGLAD